MSDQPTTQPRFPVLAAEPRDLAGCLGRFGCFLADGGLWLYELPPGELCSNPYARMIPLAPVDRLPPCYLRLRDVRRAIEEARQCVAELLELVAGGA